MLCDIQAKKYVVSWLSSSKMIRIPNVGKQRMFLANLQVVHTWRLVMACLGWLRRAPSSVPFPHCRLDHTDPPCCSQGHGKLMPQKIGQRIYKNQSKSSQHHLKSGNWTSLFSCGGLHCFPQFFTPPRSHVLWHLTFQFLPLKGYISPTPDFGLRHVNCFGQ